MELTKENRKARKTIRTFVEQAGQHGHIAAFPIRGAFRSSTYMEGSWADVGLKGSEKNRYLELSINEEYMKKMRNIEK